MPTTKSLQFTATATAADEGDAAITITTGGTDRHRDKVLPAGANLTSYLKNPVVLFGHSYSDLPVGTATSIEATEDGLKATWKWLTGDPFAERVKNAWDQGVLRAASIGFMPVKWVFDEERRGVDYLEWDLLEFSIVPVPANPEAVRTLKALDLYDDAHEQPASAPPDLAENIKALESAVKRLEDLYSIPVVEDDAVTVSEVKAVTEAVAEILAEDGDTFDLDDELILELADDNPDEFSIEPTDLRDALTAGVRDAFSETVRDAAERGVRLAQGRID